MKWTPEHIAAHRATMRALWQSGVYDNRRRPTVRPPKCVICAASENVLHFNLVIQRTDGNRGNRGAGAIDLCHQCWWDVTRSSQLKARPKAKAA